MSCSRVNLNTQLDESNWGVTLVTTAKLHQMILIEGIASGQYISKIGELTVDGSLGSLSSDGGSFCFLSDVGYTLYRDLKPNELEQRVVKKDKTYIFTKEKIEKLISKLEAQHEKDYPYHLFGSKSFFAGKAEVINLYDPLLEAIQKINPKLFQCLYDSAKNNGMCTGMNRADFNKAILKTQDKIKDADLLTIDFRYDNLIRLIKDYAGESRIIAQGNCGTWSEQQLRPFGINIEGHGFDCVATIPSWHVDTPKDELLEPVQQCDCSEDMSLDTEEEVPTATLKGRAVNYNTSRDKNPEKIKKMNERFKLADITLKSSPFIGVGIGLALGAVSVAAGPAILLGVGGFAMYAGLGFMGKFNAIYEIKRDPEILGYLGPEKTERINKGSAMIDNSLLG